MFRLFFHLETFKQVKLAKISINHIFQVLINQILYSQILVIKIQ